VSLARSALKAVSSVSDRIGSAPAGPRVLIYHQVGSGLGRQMEVTVEDFQRQLDWLVENRSVVTLDDALSQWEDPGSDRLAVLTFDDGYLDTFNTAFPLLEERGLPFTLYLATESIDSGVALGPVPGAEPLDWDKVGEMAGTGLLTVGAHTHRHQDLRLVTVEEAEDELGTSDALIEKRLGIAPAHFAYPWGFWSENAEGPVRRRYRSATLAGIANSKVELDPLRMPRYPVQLSDGLRWFPARLEGGFRLEETIRRRRNRYTGP
jgi:peptidoglycan/xylan/chitin deacetylase (PgdA/CDA1 family)